MTRAGYDLVYGVTAHFPEGELVVDYDARRLASAGQRRTRCAELADLQAEGGPPLSRICLNLLLHTAKAQWQRDLAAAASLLAPAGVLVVRASEHPRALPAVRRALQAAFDQVERSGPAELRASRPRVPAAPPTPIESHLVEHRDTQSGRILTFRTVPGLFSQGTVDKGSEVLLSVLADRYGALTGRSVLDIGCGYGALGCTLAARGAAVTLLDSDLRAVRLAQANLEHNHLPGQTVIGDAASALPAGPFDLVVSNPPTHAGSHVLQGLFDRAAGTGGRVLIVVRAQLNYEKWLQPRYQVEQLAVQQGYKIIAFQSLPPHPR
jgi:16S rRNA (guanine1207-N2)-methyltransferase